MVSMTALCDALGFLVACEVVKWTGFQFAQSKQPSAKYSGCHAQVYQADKLSRGNINDIAINKSNAITSQTQTIYCIRKRKSLNPAI